MPTGTVDMVSNLTRLVAAHGVFALAVIFIFYQQRRSYRNFQGAKTPEDHRYFRRVYTANLAATFLLVLAAGTIWWLVNVHQRPVIWGVVQNLRSQSQQPVEPGDPPRFQHRLVTESPAEADLFLFTEEKPKLSGKYHTSWVVRAPEPTEAVTFYFEHRYAGFHGELDRSRPGALVNGAEDLDQVTLHASFTLGPRELKDAHRRPVELVYELSENDSIGELGTMYIRGPGGKVKIPWDERSRSAMVDERPGWLSWLLPAVFAQEAPGSVFGYDGSYDARVGRLLRERLGGRDLKARIEARATVVAGGTRALRFIEESLTREASARAEDPNAFFAALAHALGVIEDESGRSHPDLALKLAEKLYDLGDYRRAAEIYDRIPEDRFAEGLLGYSRGYAYEHTGRLEDALRSFTRFQETASDPRDKGATAEVRARVLEELGRWDEAIAAYNEAIEYWPDFAVAKNNLAYLLAQRNRDLATALSLVEEALEQKPDNGHYLDTKGWVLYRMRRFDEALPFIERALEIYPDNKEIQEHLAVLRRGGR